MYILGHLQAIYNTLDTIQVTGVENCSRLAGCANCIKSLCEAIQKEQEARKNKASDTAPEVKSEC